MIDPATFPAGGDAGTALRAQTAVVMPRRQIEIADGSVVTLPRHAVRAGQVVLVLRHHDEYAVWSTDRDPRLLALHRPEPRPGHIVERRASTGSMAAARADG
jgi:hypothetical protein